MTEAEILAGLRELGFEPTERDGVLLCSVPAPRPPAGPATAAVEQLGLALDGGGQA